MKKLAVLSALGALLVAGACSKQSQSPAQPRYGAQYESKPADDGWTAAWNAVTEAGDEVSDAGEWTLGKAKDGAIIAWRGTKQVAGTASEETGDAALFSSVKSRLAAAEGVPSGNIDVNVDEGVVTLRGDVGTRAAASEAIRTALSTRGVDRVVSYLTWSR